MEDFDINKLAAENKKEYLEFSENDTHAMHELKVAARNRVFWKFISALGTDGFDADYVKQNSFKYLQGLSRDMQNQYIFMWREKIQPSKWYYKYSEPLPEKIDFTPKFPPAMLIEKESVGHIKLKELQKRYELKGIVSMFGVDYNQLRNIIYKRTNPRTGKAYYKTLPQTNIIISLRNVIQPDLWYIFPEEMKQPLRANKNQPS